MKLCMYLYNKKIFENILLLIKQLSKGNSVDRNLTTSRRCQLNPPSNGNEEADLNKRRCLALKIYLP